MASLIFMRQLFQYSVRLLNSKMSFMNNIVKQIFIVFFLGKVFGKNHFDADVLNNRFKVRRLLKFKLELCREIHNLHEKNSNGDVSDIFDIHIR